MHIVVTGGAGFIGSYVVDRLVADGHRVAILDSLTTQVHPARRTGVSQSLGGADHRRHPRS